MSNMMCLLTGIKRFMLQHFENVLKVADIPIVKDSLQHVAKTCGCSECVARRSEPKADGWFRRCNREQFFVALSVVISDILALSLYNHPEDVRVRVPISPAVRTEHELHQAVQEVVVRGADHQRELLQLSDWSLALIGHDVSKELTDLGWIMSCSLGQAVWPTIYDTNVNDSNSYLSLSWLPGDLRFNDGIYKLVKGPTRGGNGVTATFDLIELIALSQDLVICSLIIDHSAGSRRRWIPTGRLPANGKG